MHTRRVCLRQLVELKNGETYNGHMVQCDSWMNVHLREVICTSKARLVPWCVCLLTVHLRILQPDYAGRRTATASGAYLRRIYAATP